MRINILLSPVNVDELYFTKKTVVVIDVLRSSSTIITALSNGAREVVPVGSVEFGMKVSGGMFGGQTLLGGERNTKKIEGFSLGNSPLEYTNEIVNGKSIVLYTTNGTKAIVKSKYADNIFIASYNNLSAIVNYLLKLNNDFEILCSGKNNVFSLEDTVCAGKLVSEIMKLKEDVELSDAAKAAVSLNKNFGKSPLKMLSETEHGQILIQNGFIDDLKLCAKLNSSDVIPYFTNNSLKVLQNEVKD